MSVSSEDEGKNTNVSQFLDKLKSAELVRDWIRFGKIFLSPPVFILIIAAIILVWISLTIPSDAGIPPILDATVRVMISLLSGLVGALIYDRWSKITEGGILVTRGKSAIRGLKLLLNNIASLERRTLLSLNRLNRKDPRNKSIVITLEETIDRSNSLQEETINAIEEWQDIIPEAADLSTQIGLISRLKAEKLILVDEIAYSRTEHGQTKEASEEESKRLLAQVKKKEKQLTQVTEKLNTLQFSIDSSVLAGSSLNIGPALSIYKPPSSIIFMNCPACSALVQTTELNLSTCHKCGHVW